jgi:hypothetical protein
LQPFRLVSELPIGFYENRCLKCGRQLAKYGNRETNYEIKKKLRAQHAGKNEKGQSFAQYVHSQGGLVLFVSEFEKYLRAKTKKHFT